jgi:hypothetical protein
MQVVLYSLKIHKGIRQVMPAVPGLLPSLLSRHANGCSVSACISTMRKVCVKKEYQISENPILIGEFAEPVSAPASGNRARGIETLRRKNRNRRLRRIGILRKPLFM